MSKKKYTSHKLKYKRNENKVKCIFLLLLANEHNSLRKKSNKNGNQCFKCMS